MEKDKVLSEQDFDNDYRKASPDTHYEGIEYYHKVKVDGGYIAQVAGIHADPELDNTQFRADAFHGLAYVKPEDMPEVEDQREPDEAIMKEGKKVTIKKATNDEEVATEEK